MATRFDIGSAADPVWIGTTIAVTFTLKPTQSTVGWTTRVTFKRNRADNTAVKTYTPTPVVDGIWTIVMTEADTSLFGPGTYAYDLERIDSGNVAVLTYGYIQFDRKVN